MKQQGKDILVGLAVKHASDALEKLQSESEFTISKEMYDVFCGYIRTVVQVGDEQDNVGYYSLLLTILAHSTKQENINLSGHLCSYFSESNPAVAAAVDLVCEAKANESSRQAEGPKL